MSDKSQVSLRTVFTVCFGVALVVGLIYFITQAQLAISLTILAAMVAIALHHGVVLLERLRFPRWLAILTVALALVGAGVLVAIVLIAPAVSQAQAMAHDIPQLIEKIRQTDAFQTVDKRFGAGAAVDRVAQSAPELVFRAVNAVLSVVIGGITIFLLSLFMLIFGGPLIDKTLAELGDEVRARVEGVLVNVYNSVGGYIAGMALIASLNTLFASIFLGVMGMPFFLPLAVMSGVASLVPYVGEIVVCVIVSLLALATMGTWKMVACIIYYITYGQIEGNLFGSIIFRRTVHVNPLLITLSIVFFGEMAGLFGAFLAIPLVATLQIVVREILSARRVIQSSIS